MIYIIIFIVIKVIMRDKFKIKDAFSACIAIFLFSVVVVGIAAIFPAKENKYIAESNKNLIEFSDGVYVIKDTDNFTGAGVYSYKDITENGEIIININSKNHPVYVKYSNHISPRISRYTNHYSSSVDIVYNILFVLNPIYDEEDYYIITLPNKQAIKYI